MLKFFPVYLTIFTDLTTGSNYQPCAMLVTFIHNFLRWEERKCISTLYYLFHPKNLSLHQKLEILSSYVYHKST